MSNFLLKFNSEDSYATISLYSATTGAYLESYRTSFMANKLSNVHFNEATIFTVTTNQLRNVFIKITFFQVWSDCTQVEIGSLYLGLDENINEEGQLHWLKMMKLLRRQVFSSVSILVLVLVV